MSRQRERSKTFSTEESLLLVKLVEKYKKYILNKATNAAANQNKAVAWRKIAADFNNSSGVTVKRNSKVLKVRWDNILKKVRKIKSMGLKDPNSDEFHEIHSIAMNLISAEDAFYNADMPLPDGIEDNGSDDQAKDDNDSDESESDGSNEKTSRNRSQNFSPQESKLLLECVKKEKKHVFSKEFTTTAIEAKNQAWSRIADAYNKLSPKKRSMKCLRTKFTSIKNLARSLNYNDIVPKKIKENKHEKFTNESFESIKQELFTEDHMEDESYQLSDQEDNLTNDGLNRETNLIEAVPVDFVPDPLMSVLNGDSGIGSTSSQLASWNWHYSDNKEIIKLEKELLNYQKETAMLERKRVQDAIAEEALEREARATERVLRLRAARLDAVTAASRLPPSHPAVQYTPEEAKAMQYLNQYQEL